MKIPKAMVGKFVEMTWRDPVMAHVKLHKPDGSDRPRGLAILAVQKERGVIVDVTEGVVCIEHTEGRDSTLVPDQTIDVSCSWIQEDIVESVIVFTPEVGG